MTLHQITLFLAACQFGSLTEAAEEIHISQPSLSVAIKQLEKEFGVSLFSRYRKRLVLTDAGAAFRREALKILESASSLEEYMKDLGNPQAKIHLGLTAMSSMFFFPNLIMPFCKANPSLQVEMHELSAMDAVDQILADQIKLAIIRLSAFEKKQDEVEYIPLRRAKVVGCVRKDHRLANKTGVTLDMLENEKLIFTGEKSSTTQQILKGMQAKNIHAEVFMYSHQFLLMLQVIERFNAVGFFSEDLPKNNDKVASFEFEDSYEFVHCLVWKKGSLLLRNELKFLDFCKKNREISMTD